MLEAVNDFILEYTDITQDKLFRGWQNRMALPTENEYCLYYISNSKRIGTNLKNDSDYTADIKTLREYVMTIDINDTDNDRALERANNLEIIARSGIGAKFFKARNVGLLYADDIRYMPFTDENNQYINRYMIDLHINCLEKVTIDQDSANEVKITKLVNIDKYFFEKTIS